MIERVVKGRALDQSQRLPSWISWRAAILCALASAFSLGCGARVDPTGDSSTHFWRTCEADAQCGDSYECICGHCTKQCATEAACPGAGTSHCAAISAYLTCDSDMQACIPAAVEQQAAQPSAADAGPPNDSSDTREPGPIAPSEQSSTSTDAVDSGAETTDVAAPVESAGVETKLEPKTEASVAPVGPPRKLAWSAALPVDASSLSAGAVVSTADGAGNVLAVWTESSLVSTGGSIGASFYSPKAGWEPPVQLAASEVYLSTLCAHSSKTGSAVAAWFADDLGTGVVWGATFSKAGGWSEPVQLGPSQGSVVEIDCVADEQGMARVFWSQNDGASYLLHAARLGDGVSSGYQLIGGNTRDAFHVSAAVDAAGNALALWTAIEDSVPGLWSIRMLADGSWQLPERMNTTPAMSIPDHGVALRSDGGGRAVWSEQTQFGDDYQIQSSSFSVEGGWSTPETLGTGHGYSSLVRVGNDDDGNALVVWDEVVSDASDVQTPNVRLTHLTTKDGWHELGLAEGLSLLIDSERPTLSMSSTGQALVAWRHLRQDSTGQIVAAHFSPELGWSAALALDQAAPTSDMSWPAAAVGDVGAGNVVWVQSDPLAPSGDVFAASYGE